MSHHRLPSFSHYLLLMLASLSLAACNKPPAQAMLEDYAERVGRVLEIDITLDLEAASLAVTPLPQRRERLLATADIREGLLDVLDFQQCGLLHSISKRNSSLGKVMPPSQKIQYEVQFLEALQRCRTQIEQIAEPDEDDLEFLERIKTIERVKRANLPAEIWNAIYTAEEVTAHFAIGHPPLALTGGDPAAVQQALQQLQTLALLDPQTNLIAPDWLDQVEAPYFAFYSSDFGSASLTSLVMLTQTLDRTAEAIEKRLAAKPFCFDGHRNPRADILDNVFRRYYAAQVQAYMAVIQREVKPWLAAHDAMMMQLPTPPAMRRYQQQVVSLSAENSLWQQWQTASMRHTKAWQTLLTQCNLMPKSAVNAEE